MVESRRRSLGTALVLGVVVLLAFFAALMIGEYALGPREVFAALFGFGDGSSQFLVLEVRAPRALAAVGVGVAFAISGAIFQSVVRNPLGTPEIIGFTQGASAGAVAGITLAGVTGISLTGWAVGGGLIAALLVWFFAFRRGVSGYRLIIVGIGVGAILNAVTWWLLSRANLATAQGAMSWLIGSLSARSWAHVGVLLISYALLIPVLVLAERSLRILEMGDDVATGLGVRVPTATAALLGLGVVTCALAVSVAGPVPFIALAAPQIAGRIARSPGVTLLNSALIGALLLLVSDIIAAHAWPGKSLPVGVVTGVVGGAYLAWILVSPRRVGR